MKTHKPITKTILTNEEWYPTKDGRVKVNLIDFKKEGWSVSVWGDDDIGLERVFPLEYGVCIRDKAVELYDKIVDYTTQEQMRGWGMYNA